MYRKKKLMLQKKQLKKTKLFLMNKVKKKVLGKQKSSGLVKKIDRLVIYK